MPSEMTSRLRVRTALSHQQPDRVPFSWGFCATPEMNRALKEYFAGQHIDWEKLKQLVSDKCGIAPDYTGPPPANGNAWVGIWGINVKEISYGAGEYQEFTDFPLAGIEDPQQLHDYPWPDPANYDYENMRRKFLEINPGNLRAVQYGGGNPFEIYCWMTGLEEALINLLVNPEVVRTALTYITDFYRIKLEKSLEQVGDLIDMAFFADDLGTQNGLLISRENYVELLQPFHRQLTETVKAKAPHIFTMLHSDGAVFDLLPDIIDAGVQVHEAVQTDAQGMQPERLKSTYGDRLCFHGGISVQQLLPNHDYETVKEECKRLVAILGEHGGYIAAPTHAIQVGTPPENIKAMLEGVLGKERYAEFADQAAI